MDTPAADLHTGIVASVCALTGWSAVTSAPANATLAGILAGFMLNGIVLLLSRRSNRTQLSGYAQGAALLFMAFIALGLDSYLFGLVTGDGTARACRRAWTEAMFAAGLLGLGAVEVVVGIVFLLGVLLPATQRGEAADRQGNTTDDDYSIAASRDLLAGLCNVLRPGVAVVVMFLLWMTARSYLGAVFKSNAPLWAHLLIWVEVGIGYIILTLYVVIHRGGRTRWGRNILAWLEERIHAADIGAPRKILYRTERQILNLIWINLQPDPAGGIKTLRTLKFAVMSSLVYSITSVVFVGALVLFPVTFWNSAHLQVNLIIGGTIIWVLLVSLVPLSALLAPGYGPQYTLLKPCVFCGKPVGRPHREHVIPRWARRAFDIQGPLTAKIRQEPRADWRKRVDEMPQLNFTLRNAICPPCNRHWLGPRLERAVKPILEPMAVSAKPTTLDQAGQALIATWAVKTVMLFERANPAGRPVDGYPACGREFAQQRTKRKPPEPPPGSLVWLGHWDPGHTARVIYEPGPPWPTSDGLVLGHTLALGLVAVQVFTVDYETKQHVARPWNTNVPPALEQTLIRIWPPPPTHEGSAPKVSWPPDAVASEDWERLVTWDGVLRTNSSQAKRRRSRPPEV